MLKTVKFLFALTSASFSPVVVNAQCPFSGLLRGSNISSTFHNENSYPEGQSRVANTSGTFSWYRDYYYNFTKPPPEADLHRSLGQSSCGITMQVPTLPRHKLKLSKNRQDYNDFVLAIYDAFVAETKAPQQLFTPAGALRIAFHECIPFNQYATGRGGCRGDIALEVSQRFPPNDRLVFTYNRISELINSGKFGRITFADAVHIAASVAVQAYGGPKYEVKIGRAYDFTSEDVCPDPKICWPPPNFPQGNPITVLSDFIQKMFKNAGFRDPTKAVVVSSGAHTFGGSRIFPGFDWTKDPYAFNNGYHQTVMNWWKHGGPNIGGFDFLKSLGLSSNECPIGLFHSDMMLGDPRLPFRQFTEVYANNQSAFFSDFASFMKECSLKGVANPHELVDP